MGNKTLVAANIASRASTSGSNNQEVLHKDFLAYKASQEEILYKDFLANKAIQEKTEASYAKTVSNDADDDIRSWDQNPHKEVILLLENKDLKWKDQPWMLINRYMDTGFYPTETYKSRMYYEYILKAESCEIDHYTQGVNSKEYTFSKIIIKQIKSVETWGTSPLREREVIHPETKAPIRYNYWDYMNAFYKAFLYENPKQKHSWFIKIYIHDSEIPTWFYKWWLSYGPSIRILPDLYKDLYTQWVELSPTLLSQIDENFIEGMPSLQFFTQFSIPWIWKWLPESGYTTENIFCLKRAFYTKFWKKMIKIQDGVLESQQTIDHIQETLSSYKEQRMIQQQRESPSPFQHMARKLKIIKGDDNISNKEIMNYYLQEMKKDLMKNLKKSPTAMSISGSSQNEDDDSETILAGESQADDDLDEAYINDIIKNLDNEANNTPDNKAGKKKLHPQ